MFALLWRRLGAKTLHDALLSVSNGKWRCFRHFDWALKQPWRKYASVVARNAVEADGIDF
jgi:hypothetical protein